jgi:hypothetical protein
MADVYDNMGDSDTALEIFEKCFEGQKSALGEQHPDTLDTISNISAVREKMQ